MSGTVTACPRCMSNAGYRGAPDVRCGLCGTSDNDTPIVGTVPVAVAAAYRLAGLDGVRALGFCGFPFRWSSSA